MLLVQNLHKPEILKDYLYSLGARHVQYGVKEEHYPAIAENLLAVMAEFAGELWVAEVEKAWQNTLNTVATIMIEAYQPVEADQMDKANNQQSLAQEIAMMRSAINGSMTATMMIDRDFKITYVNDATLSMLKPYVKTLKEIFPGFNLKKLVGTNIDTFHQDPTHQRQLLSDPANLPINTDIEVGPLSFNLNVTAMINDDGNYLGNTLEWANVTEVRAKEQEVARLSGTIDGAMTSIMMIDRDFNITYVNDATVNMLAPYVDTLKEIFPSFDLDNLVGTNIDTFHKDPSHQRKLLADPKNLPYSTDITVDPLSFNLNVTAIIDPQGDYLGNALEWTNVTEVRAKENEIARLQSAVEGAASSLMICDADRVITFANPSVMKMLEARLPELRKVFPQLDLSKVLGTCIDDFHKDPSLQKGILQDIDKLPYRTQIQS